MIVLDATDAPLGATERTVATLLPELALRGLGLAALDHRGALYADAKGAARDALRKAIAASSANVRFDAIPRSARRLRASALVERAWAERGEARVLLTIAGAVENARVVAADPATTIESLVAPTTRAWVALYGSAEVARTTLVADLIDRDAPRVLLILPAGHALVRRARTPLSTWLLRARSACASCAMCAPACPEGIPIPELLRSLAGGRARVSATKLATSTSCTTCNACDLACPQAISPMRIVDTLGARLRVGGVTAKRRHPRVEPLDDELAVARLGLRRYARPMPLELFTS